MAGITNYGGLWTVQFTGMTGKRHSVRLGRVNKRQAESARRFIGELVKARVSGEAPPTSTVEWATGLPEKIHNVLVKGGLADPPKRGERPTVAAWAQAYIDGRTDLKPGTRTNLLQAASNLAAFFGPTRRLDNVTLGDAKEFRTYLKSDCGLSEGTVRRRVKRARQFFSAAVEKEIIGENPFVGIRCSDYSDAGRFHFVSRADAQAVLDHCPDSQWRLIFALCRFGALRCPSEVLSLTWADVDWARSRFAVHSAKTEDTGADGGTRHVPIFPELLPHLREAFEQAASGQTWIVAGYRAGTQNLRTQLARIIRRAGLVPWEKLFQNCRATREIELCETFSQHVVAKWLGHSESVARRHYLNVTEDHYRRAAEEPTGAAQNPVQGAVQNPVQQVSARTRKDSQDGEGAEATAERKALNSEPLREDATGCENAENILRNVRVTPTGLEPVSRP